MRPQWLLAVAVGCLLAADKPKDDPAKKDLDKMQGTWAVTIHVAEGRQATDEENKKADVKLVVKGDKYSVSFGGQEVTKGTIKLDAVKKPKTIDAVADDGPFQGKAMPGIYELEGDEMKVCFAQPGKERPADFSAKEGSARTLITYKRIKP